MSGRTILQGDRLKAYRPLPAPARHAAFEAALETYAAGEFFETHELLEPAWMGTDILAERALHQGLIKLAAGYVHAGRGNAAGLVKNLEGARRHLALAGPAAPDYAIDVTPLVADIDTRLAALRDGDTGPMTNPPGIRRTAAS